MSVHPRPHSGEQIALDVHFSFLLLRLSLILCNRNGISRTARVVPHVTRRPRIASFLHVNESEVDVAKICMQRKGKRELLCCTQHSCLSVVRVPRAAIAHRGHQYDGSFEQLVSV